MKNWPLFWQLWVWFVGMVAGVAVLILLGSPYTIKQFFSNEIGEQLNEAQVQVINQIEAGQGSFPEPRRPDRVENLRSVRHMLFTRDGEMLIAGRGGGRREFSNEMMRALKKEIIQLDMRSENGKNVRLEQESELIFASIRPITIAAQPIVLVSWIEGSYYHTMVNTLFRQIIGVVIVALVLSWIPALVLARHLSKPLVQMQKHMQRIARHEWHEPIPTERNDEIGKLSQAAETMRQELLQAEKEQQTLLQHLSHEMKTPVMIIRSYIQSIKDGIYPRGDLSLSLETMDNQTIRLQKRIADLIFFTKLKHWSEQPLTNSDFEFDQLIDGVLDGYRHQRQEIQWDVELEPIRMNGDAGRWQVALENLFENQLRYAKTMITVKLERNLIPTVHSNESDEVEAVLNITNDGDPMPDSLMGNRFEPFQKGLGGQHGLGLAIAQRIFELHGAQLQVSNTTNGVCFCIIWRQKRTQNA